MSVVDDNRLLEALRDLRYELQASHAELRREVRDDMREVREAALGLIRRLVWTVTVLGLALGGKELVALAVGGAP